DTFIFYISTHGDYALSNSPAPNELVYFAETDTDPDTFELARGNQSLVMTDVETTNDNDTAGELSDDEFSSWFRGNSNWVGVNKLFIIDSCYSGGFWGNP